LLFVAAGCQSTLPSAAADWRAPGAAGAVKSGSPAMLPLAQEAGSSEYPPLGRWREIVCDRPPLVVADADLDCATAVRLDLPIVNKHWVGARVETVISDLRRDTGVCIVESYAGELPDVTVTMDVDRAPARVVLTEVLESVDRRWYTAKGVVVIVER
jgi:hypothetical protein